MLSIKARTSIPEPPPIADIFTTLLYSIILREYYRNWLSSVYVFLRVFVNKYKQKS